MNRLSSRFVVPVLLALIASSAPLFGADTSTTAPAPGYYAGTVRITKILGPEGLFTTNTLPAQAKVASDGTVAVMVNLPQMLSAAEVVDSTVTRFVPVFSIYNGINYSVDGRYPASGIANGKLLTLTYEVPPRPNPMEPVVTGPGVILASKTTYEFKLRSRPAPIVPGAFVPFNHLEGVTHR